MYRMFSEYLVMIVNKSNGKANPVLANFPFVPTPPRSTKLISVPQAVGAHETIQS